MLSWLCNPCYNLRPHSTLSIYILSIIIKRFVIRMKFEYALWRHKHSSEIEGWHTLEAWGWRAVLQVYPFVTCILENLGDNLEMFFSNFPPELLIRLTFLRCILCLSSVSWAGKSKIRKESSVVLPIFSNN